MQKPTGHGSPLVEYNNSFYDSLRISDDNSASRSAQQSPFGTSEKADNSTTEDASSPGECARSDAMGTAAAEVSYNARTLQGKSAKEGNGRRRFGAVQSFNLWLMMLFMGAQLSLPYTLSVYLVRNFYEGKSSEQVIGQLTGLLAASQSFARSLTAYPWGILSDSVGRKVCIIVGQIASLVSLVSYGMASTYTNAILARALPALFLASPVAIKSMIGDVCDQEGQAQALAIFSLGHGIGSIVGPSLAGLLSYPCSNLPGIPFCKEGQLLQKFPFLLPCLAVCLIGLPSLAGSIFLLKESHPRLVSAPGGWLGNLVRLLCCRRAVKEDNADPHDESLLPKSYDSRLTSLDSHLTSKPSDVEMGKFSAKPAGSGSPNPIAAAAPWESSQEDSPSANAHEEEVEEEEEKESQSLLQPASQAEEPSNNSDYRWWRDKRVRLALMGSGLCAFLFNMLDEMAPIFVSAPLSQGGLSMSLENFTWPISAGGVALVAFSLAVYPKLIKRMGALPLCRVGLLMGIPGAIVIPMSSLFVTSRIWEQVCIYAGVCLHQTAKITALNSSMIVVNMVAPKGSMGAVNGGANTLQSGGRALGPLLCGTIWAVVVSLHVAGQQFLGFGIAIVALICTQFLYASFQLPAAQ